MENIIEIPNGYEARIEGNKVVLEPKASEDERMRRLLIKWCQEHEKEEWFEYEVATYEDVLAWLEKKKEQKPAEWSEEDETAFGDLMWCMEQARKSAKDENDMGNIWFAENWVKNRLKSLRPQSHWKPSEEQMEALNAILCHGGLSYVGQQKHLISLYNDIKKL